MAEPVAVTESFEGFYRRAWHDAARWATALTGDAATGEEIAQDAFVRIGPRFDELSNPGGYLRVVVVNLARSSMRSNDISPETSSTYATVPAVEVPYFAVGESVMLGAKSDLDARGIRTVDVEAADWKLVLGGLQQAKSEFHIAGGVVIQLGTNGTVRREEYEAVLAEVADLPRVVVMTVTGSHPWIQGNNEIIRSLPLAHPNVVVLDWEVRSAEIADHLASDGIHLRDDVAKAFYTNLVLEALGLPRCGGSGARRAQARRANCR